MRLAPLALLPKGALLLLKEVARHLLHRPIVGIAAVAKTPDGKLVLIRRADTGEWALPGGTLDWGETLVDALARELKEEAAVPRVRGTPRLLGVFSGVDRDPRFHAVTVAVACDVDPPAGGAQNPLEIREIGLFAPKDRPPLAMGMDDYVALAERNEPAVLE